MEPSKNETYGSQEYWQARYREPGGVYEWCLGYAALSAYFDRLLPIRGTRCKSDLKIVMLGCGNSALAEDMYDDGYRCITSIDYAQNVIDAMSARNALSRPELQWLQADVRNLPLPDASIDICIDKATMDVFFAAAGSKLDPWNPPASVIENCNREIDEVVRLQGAEAGRLLHLRHFWAAALPKASHDTTRLDNRHV
ncbi:hypothetical protein E5Q_02473 [Mixia osmundae IAM 14324]|uniref:Methyltransferase domain-containing protein n=1 Tax=Mixia osmundae (strain CBS 9802 / IAM 14324 / JCM 22182 / KY 12970) TaxID=764103 RepID=G7DZ05_MIXOS|nr:hypothetical protein E5Q_02473 [Mixia osmundae IAM 14324]